jgi:hypothetical protein
MSRASGEGIGRCSSIAILSATKDPVLGMILQTPM